MIKHAPANHSPPHEKSDMFVSAQTQLRDTLIYINEDSADRLRFG